MTHEEYVQVYIAWLMGATVHFCDKKYINDKGMTVEHWAELEPYHVLEKGSRWILEVIARKQEGYEEYINTHIYKVVNKGE